MADQSKSKPKIHYPKLGVCLFIGFIIWWLPVPNLPDGLILPDGADFTKGWCVFAVFAATILCFILRPMPMGPTVLLALVVLVSDALLVALLFAAGFDFAAALLALGFAVELFAVEDFDAGLAVLLTPLASPLESASITMDGAALDEAALDEAALG